MKSWGKGLIERLENTEKYVTRKGKAQRGEMVIGGFFCAKREDYDWKKKRWKVWKSGLKEGLNGAAWEKGV